MSNKAPEGCPGCKRVNTWVEVGEDNKGFSVGKSFLGAMVFGPVGLVAGALGKKKVTYFCSHCKFQADYDK